MDELVENRYVQAIAVAVAFIGLSRLAYWLLSGQVRRLARRTETKFDDRLIDLLDRPVTLTVAVLGLNWATHLLELPTGVEWVTLGVLKSITIFVWMLFGFRFANLVQDAFIERGDRSPLPERTLPLFNNLAKVIVAGLAAYFFFLTWSIDVTAWLASAGIIGIAVGFAAKDTLANLFAGVFILADAPYKVGDFIVLGTGERGLVTHIGIRSTRLLTRDDIEITIPNAVISSAMITNESGGPYEKRRLRIKLQVAYGTDVDHLRRVLLELATANPEVAEEPHPRVRFRSFGDSGLNFELLVWIDLPVMRGRVEDALNTQAYKRLTEEGIQIPFPVRDVRVVHETAAGE